MSKVNRNKEYHKKGFTMVELIVVIVIILVLAAVLVPSLLKYINKAQRAHVLNGCSTCVTVAQGLLIEAYVDDSLGDDGLDAELVRKEAGASGIVSGIDINDEPELMHLSYTEGKIKVTYCARPESCAVKHKEHYNFEDADGESGNGGGGETAGDEGMPDPGPGPSPDAGGGNGGSGGDSENGGGNGEVTLTDSSGGKHVLKPNGDWEEIKKNVNGNQIKISPGTILSDDTGTYIVYSWDDSLKLSDVGNTLQKLTEENPNNVRKISEETKIWTDADIVSINGNKKWVSQPKAGDIRYIDGKYYIFSSDKSIDDIYPGGEYQINQ